MKVRGSGSGAPSSRSRDARKSISSCFSAGESPAAADSISASVTIQTSVHRTEVARQGNSRTPRVPEEASFRDHRVLLPAASSEEARASDAASSSAPRLLVPAENHFVLDPTRGAFFAGCRTGSHGAAPSSVHQALPIASSGNKGSIAARIARAFSIAFVALASDASATPP